MENRQGIVLNLGETKGADGELKLVSLDSDLWETFRGAYGNVVNDVKLITGEEKELDEHDIALLNRRQSRQGEKENASDVEKIALDNLFESIAHQMTFYPAIYIVMPYLVKLLEKRRADNDFDGQLSLISDMGLLVAIDNFDDDDGDGIDRDILESFNISILKLQEITKRFLEQNIDKIRQLKTDSYYKIPFLTSVLGILGNDRKASAVMFMSMWESCFMVCPECEDCNEDIEFYSMDELKEAEGIIPADSVIGQWDGTSLDNTYVWFTNLLLIAGEDMHAEYMSYFYGTYECRECGKKNQVIELMKEYYFGE